MKFMKLQLIFFLMVTPVILHAQDSLRNDTVSRKIGFIEDDPVVSMLDSLASLEFSKVSHFLIQMQIRLPDQP